MAELRARTAARDVRLSSSGKWITANSCSKREAPLAPFPQAEADLILDKANPIAKRFAT
jgi:hypothetical protein